MLAAKRAENIGNQPRIGRSGIAKRSVCLLIWHCLTSENAGHRNASLLPRELLKHFTGANQGYWRVLRPEHLARTLQSVSRRSRNSLHPSSFPFDLTRAAFFLAGGTLVSRLLASQRKRERGCDAQKSQKWVWGRWIHCSSRPQSWASNKSQSQPLPPQLPLPPKVVPRRRGASEHAVHCFANGTGMGLASIEDSRSETIPRR